MSTTGYNGFLLGSTKIVHAGETLKLNSRKALGLLGYLAQQGRPIERDWLIELLWSEDDAPGAKGSMRTLLKNLRKQLGEAFYADRQVVALEPNAITWDIDRFSALAAQDDIAAWVQASALYQGEFMRGFQLDASVEFEDWLETTRHFWFDAVNRVLRNISDYYLHHDQAEKALAYTRRWLELEPWQEKAHRQQMWLQWQLGNFDDALAQYERCATRLERDLGIEPSPQTHELYELILKDQSSHRWQNVQENAQENTRENAQPDPAATPAPERPPATAADTIPTSVTTSTSTPKVTSTPAPAIPTTSSSATCYDRTFRQRYALSSFVGRTREMTTLRHALQQHRLVSVVGLAGVGKSRLAYELLWGVGSRQQQQQNQQQNEQHSTLQSNANTAQDNHKLHKLAADTAHDENNHDENNNALDMLTDVFADVQVMAGTTLTAAELEDYFVANSTLGANASNPQEPARASLLLIDGLLEPFTEVRDVLSEYLTTRPYLQVLVTARYPLDVAGEKRLYLRGLEPPPESTPWQDALQSDAVQLFYERARLRVSGFSLDANNTPAIITLCRLVSGLPRALEQLAAWLEIMPVRSLKKHLLEPSDPTTVRPDWLTTLLDASWQPLNENQRLRYAACAVLADGFTAEAAHAVTDMTVPQLHTLVSRSLLEVAQGRYALPHVLRPLLLRYLNDHPVNDHPVNNHPATDNHNPHAADSDSTHHHTNYHTSPQTRPPTSDIQQLATRHAAFYMSCLTVPGALSAADNDNVQRAWRYVCNQMYNQPTQPNSYFANHTTNHPLQATTEQDDLEHPYLTRYLPLLVTHYRRYGSLATLQTLLEHTWHAVAALPATALQLHILAYSARISLQRRDSPLAYDYLEQAHARSNLSSLSLGSLELYEPTSSTPDTSLSTASFSTDPVVEPVADPTSSPNNLTTITPNPPKNASSSQGNILTTADKSASQSANQPRLAMIEAMNAVLLARGIYMLLMADDAAEAHFEGLLEQPSYQLPARYYLACLALQQGDVSTAREWQRALEARAKNRTSTQQNTHPYLHEYARDYARDDHNTVSDDGGNGDDINESNINESNITAKRWLLAMRLELASGRRSNARRHFARLRKLAERTRWRDVAFQVAFYGATLHEDPCAALEHAFDIAYARADHLGALAAASAWLWCAHETNMPMPRRSKVQSYVVNMLEHPSTLPTTSLLTALLALAALNLNSNDEMAYILAAHVAQHPASPFDIRQQALKYLEVDVPDAPERDVLALLPAALDSLTPCA